MEQTKPKKLFFLILFCMLFVLAASLFTPFFTVLMWAAFFYFILNPFYQKMIISWPHFKNKSLRETKRNIWAAIFAFSSLFIIGLPLSLLIVELSRQLEDLLTALTVLIKKNPQLTSLDELEIWLKSLNLKYIDLSEIDLHASVINLIDSTKGHLLKSISFIAGGIGNFILSYIFMIFSLFFFFVDGRRLAHLLVSVIPIENSYSFLFLNRFKEAGIGILLGFFLTALIQGTIAFIVFSLFKVEAALAWAALISFASFIPMFGTATIWVPLALMEAASGGLGSGIFFAAVCGVSIALPDNFIRPLLLGDRVNIHPLLIFFSILGGIKLFGINGLILGPLTLTLFFTSLEIFQKDSRLESF